MKKGLIFVLVLVAIVAAIATFYVFNLEQAKVGENMTTFSSSEFGFAFDYKTGPEGYVLDERIPADLGDYLRTYILYRTEDKKNIDSGNIPQNGEGPAVMTVSVFKNSQKQDPLPWAMAHETDSGIALKTGEPKEEAVGGAKAIRFSADGLYASENFVVTHGDNVYVFTGQYMDKESDLYKDFEPLIDSVKFMPSQGQE